MSKKTQPKVLAMPEGQREQLGGGEVFRLRTVDGLHVYRYKSAYLTLPWSHRPVIACHHVPVGDGTGRWVWAVCLGRRQPGGPVRDVAVQQFVLTEPSDRRYRWLYDEPDWDDPSELTRSRTARLARQMSSELEECLAGTLRSGRLYYRDDRKGIVRVHRNVAYSSLTRAERSDPTQCCIDLILTAYVVAVQDEAVR